MASPSEADGRSRMDAGANWSDQRGRNRVVAYEDRGYLGMLLTDVSGTWTGSVAPGSASRERHRHSRRRPHWRGALSHHRRRRSALQWHRTGRPGRPRSAPARSWGQLTKRKKYVRAVGTLQQQCKAEIKGQETLPWCALHSLSASTAPLPSAGGPPGRRAHRPGTKAANWLLRCNGCRPPSFRSWPTSSRLNPSRCIFTRELHPRHVPLGVAADAASQGLSGFSSSPLS